MAFSLTANASLSGDEHKHFLRTCGVDLTTDLQNMPLELRIGLIISHVMKAYKVMHVEEEAEKF